MDEAQVLDRVRAISDGFAAQRAERQGRRHLDPDDFAALADAGFLATGLPREDGGLWSGLAGSVRPVCEILRALAAGDPSVALVSAMHPAVLSFWLATPEVPSPHSDAWREQRREVFASASAGSWWGTITSEPGSGGDVTRSRATARPDGDGGYRLSGAKHFGSGSGIASYMVTTAVAEGDGEPDWFYLPVGGVPWDGSAGMSLLAEWDGHGMTATQSHGMTFEDFRAVRFAWPGHLIDLQLAAGPFIGALFTAVIVGVLDTAVAAAREQLARRADDLRHYERTEWAQAEMEGWLADQAYEGMLRALETGRPALGAVVRGKTGVSQLAESSLTRICRVLGGGTYARHSPFGWWFEDVRALGYLRPPWGLAFDYLYAESFTPVPGGPPAR
jgi:alkylation response protein AidB-like acyl-CoA dehydrogenase